HLDRVHLRQRQHEIARLAGLAEQGREAPQRGGDFVEQANELGTIDRAIEAALGRTKVFAQAVPDAEQTPGAGDTLVERAMGGQARIGPSRVPGPPVRAAARLRLPRRRQRRPVRSRARGAARAARAARAEAGAAAAEELPGLLYCRPAAEWRGHNRRGRSRLE